MEHHSSIRYYLLRNTRKMDEVQRSPATTVSKNTAKRFLYSTTEEVVRPKINYCKYFNSTSLCPNYKNERWYTKNKGNNIENGFCGKGVICSVPVLYLSYCYAR